METLLASIDTSSLVGKLVLIVIVVTITVVADRAVVGVSRKALEKAEVPSASILINIERVLIWSFALLFILKPVFGIEPTGFVAALGVTSVALSLGLQDTISNVIGGLSLMLTKVVKPGDVITVSGFTGTVTDINWRSTVVQARGGNVNVIPNSVLSKTAFTKLTEGAAAACPLVFCVRHDADPAEVEQDMITAAAGALGSTMEVGRLPVVKFGEVGAYGITVTLTVFIKPDVLPADANDAVSRALVGRSWLAHVA